MTDDHAKQGPPDAAAIEPLAQMAGRALSRVGIEKVLFADDPRAAMLSACVYRLLMVETPQGIAVATGGQAVMIAIGPGIAPKKATWAWLKAAFIFLKDMGLAKTWWFMRFDRFAQAMRLRLMQEPHLYIRLLAVDPSVQGKGLGGRLLSQAIDQAEREGLPLYLETHEAENVSFYRRFGFEVKEEKLLDIGVMHYGMVRPFRTM